MTSCAPASSQNAQNQTLHCSAQVPGRHLSRQSCDPIPLHDNHHDNHAHIPAYLVPAVSCSRSGNTVHHHPSLYRSPMPAASPPARPKAANLVLNPSASTYCTHLPTYCPFVLLLLILSWSDDGMAPPMELMVGVGALLYGSGLSAHYGWRVLTSSSQDVQDVPSLLSTVLQPADLDDERAHRLRQ